MNGPEVLLGLLIAKDVTEARLKESLYTQALKDACESANQANQAKSEFCPACHTISALP